MLTEPFASGKSLLHRLDPRVRVVAATTFSIIVALSFKFSVLVAALIAALTLLVVARLNTREVLKRMLVINGFVLLLWLIVPLTFPGEVISKWGPIKLYLPGVVLSAQITLKSNTIFLILISLVATMPFATLGHCLHHLGLPDKLVFLLLMSYRYVFVIEQEYRRLMRAAKIRGFRPTTSRHTYRTFAYMVGMLFVRSTDRAERVYQAMRCRGFRDKFRSLRQFRTTAVDGAFSALMAVLVVGLAYMEWATH